MFKINGSRAFSLFPGQVTRIVAFALALVMFMAPVGGNLASAQCGDMNGDGRINLNDVLFLIAYIFLGGPPPDPIEDGDANCDGTANISDAIYLIDAIFRGGPLPCGGQESCN